MTHAIQYVEPAHDQDEAQGMLDWLATQIDYIAGRLLPPGGGAGKETWRVQAFFDSTGITRDTWLPDGCQLVVIPPGLGRSLGINPNYGKESRSIQLD